MISIIDKMIAYDLIKTLLSVLSVIVIIIVSRKFIKVLSQVVDGHISSDTALHILGLKIIIAIDSFLPASIFMAVLMVLGRMYRDQEMAAIASAGGGAKTIYNAVFIVIIPLLMISTTLSMVATPWAESSIRLLIHEDKKSAELRGIAAGRFTETNHGNLVFYTEDIKNKIMLNVFVQQKTGEKTSIIVAKQGEIEFLPGGLYLILKEGEKIQGVAGEKNYLIEQFDEYAVRLEKKTHAFNQKREGIPTQTLWNSSHLADKVEIQKRMATPLAVFFLGFLAVPLAKLSPRAGVYGNLMIAFAIYFIYGNLQRLSHSWVMSETVPLIVGYFWVYLLLFALGIFLLVRLYGIQWISMLIMKNQY